MVSGRVKGRKRSFDDGDGDGDVWYGTLRYCSQAPRWAGREGGTGKGKRKRGERREILGNIKDRRRNRFAFSLFPFLFSLLLLTGIRSWFLLSLS